MSTEPRSATGTLVVRSMDDLARLGNMLAQSGYFTDARDAAQAGVKVLAGLEMGIGAFSAMAGIHVIKGKPSVGAGLMAAAVKRHFKYDYRVTKHTTGECSIDFYEGAEVIGTSSFTLEDAKAAGLIGNDNWKRNPRNMVFARAMSNGVRWYCPDVFDVSTYTPEELGAEVDDEGNIVDVPSRAQAPTERPALAAPVVEPTPAEAVAPEPVQAIVEPAEPAATGPQLKKLAIVIKNQSLDRDQARAFLGWLVKRDLASATELTKAEAARVLDWSDDQWAAALVDYANELAGGVPEPDWSGVPVPPASDAAPFEPNGRSATRQKVAS
jgi:hypothetical protein